MLQRDLFWEKPVFFQNKSYVEELDIYEDLVKKYVTGYSVDGVPLTTTYNSWYDISCNESCDDNCDQAIPALQFIFGQLIEKEPTNLLGNGGQGSVFECTWHGKKAAAKFIPNPKIPFFELFGDAPQNLMDPLREKKMRQLYTSKASEFYIAREIKHPHVLHVFDFFLQHNNCEDEFVIVSELCESKLSQIKFNFSAIFKFFLQSWVSIDVCSATCVENLSQDLKDHK